MLAPHAMNQHIKIALLSQSVSSLATVAVLVICC